MAGSRISGSPRRKVTLPADAALERLIHETDRDILAAVAADSRLTEDLALAMLERNDLPREVLEQLLRNRGVAELRKVRLALVAHPRAPRHLSIPVIRHLYPFELMQIALSPAVAADVRRAAEEAIITRLASISSGERFTLSKRSSARVAASLLLDQEDRVVRASLENPRMTELWIVRALKTGTGTELLAAAVARHPKWSQRIEIKAALLGNRYTSFAEVVRIAAELPLHALKDGLQNARLAPNVKRYLQAILADRTGNKNG
jgi:hypothetical protein